MPERKCVLARIGCSLPRIFCVARFTDSCSVRTQVMVSGHAVQGGSSDVSFVNFLFDNIFRSRGFCRLVGLPEYRLLRGSGRLRQLPSALWSVINRLSRFGGIVEGQTSRRATGEQIVTLAHGHSQSQKKQVPIFQFATSMLSGNNSQLCGHREHSAARGSGAGSGRSGGLVDECDRVGHTVTGTILDGTICY
ncbi:hypothetical protein EVAR_56051_1 [Eumeta japonica]|uniref:Uncharacterized protein n=1 Tax=Eumeta variegata TaxID=151549 RepID=A0A4C1YAE6_EUMVA|nr:hypothetical protein EVAR_56051_1 [Eumeta japonica]